MKPDYDVIIIGGGLAGLTSAIMLSRAGNRVLVIERKKYPFHKVCGEYISNEVLPFLKSMGLNPFDYGASAINRLRISTPKGKKYFSELDLGGFGLSRFVLENELHRIAIRAGTTVLAETKVNQIDFKDTHFELLLNDGSQLSSKLVIGAYGKRDALDKKLKRRFMDSRTHFMAVKYHIRTDYPANEIGLDTFENGYCGIAKIEAEKYNLCYLYKHSDKRSIEEIEQQVLFSNPVIKSIFQNSEFLTAPLAINEISFERKRLIVNHVLMCGDTAGLITPLCGNGMSMAIHAAKMLSDMIINSGILKTAYISSALRENFERKYILQWNEVFQKRLFIGRLLQQLIMHQGVANISIGAIHAIPSLKKWFIHNSHGETIVA